jgi:hypothetical protein
MKVDLNITGSVRIGYGDKALREKARAAQGKWDPKTQALYLQFGKMTDAELKKFIIA